MFVVQLLNPISYKYPRKGLFLFFILEVSDFKTLVGCFPRVCVRGLLDPFFLVFFFLFLWFGISVRVVMRRDREPTYLRHVVMHRVPNVERSIEFRVSIFVCH